MDVLGCLYSDVERHREQHVQAVQWSTNNAQQAEEAKAERIGWQKDTFWAPLVTECSQGSRLRAARELQPCVESQ